MTVGEALAEARGAAGLSVDEVSERTKIRQIVIRSIEQDDYDSLGGDLYVRGYLRAIAGVVGVDPQPLIREFDASRPGGPVGWPTLARYRPAATAAQPAAITEPGAAVTKPDMVAAQPRAIPEPAAIPEPEDVAEPEAPAAGVTVPEAAEPEAISEPAAAEPEAPAPEGAVPEAPAPAAAAPDPLEPASPEPDENSDEDDASPWFASGPASSQPASPQPMPSEPASPQAANPVVPVPVSTGPVSTAPEDTMSASTVPADGAGVAPTAADPVIPVSANTGPASTVLDDMGLADLVWLDSVTGHAAPAETTMPDLEETGSWQPAPASQPVPTPGAESPRESPARTPPAGTPGKARPAGRSRARGWRWGSGIAVLVVAVLAVVAFASGQIVTKVRHPADSAPTARPSAIGPARASAPAGLGEMSAPAPQTPAPQTAAPARPLAISAAAAFGPDGTSDGDNPQTAAGAITPHAPGGPWESNWYVTPTFGDLQKGTGLLLDMGQPVALSSVRIRLSSARGSDLQLRAGDTPLPNSLAVRATASDVGGTVTLHPSARARYILLWFTKLPPLSPGKYQVSVYSVAVTGHK